MKKFIIGLVALASITVGSANAGAAPSPSIKPAAVTCNTPTYKALAGAINGDGWFDMCANAMTVHDYSNNNVTAFFYVYIQRFNPYEYFEQVAVMAPPGGWVTRDFTAPLPPDYIRAIQPCVVFPYGNNPFTVVCDQQIAVPVYDPM